jgi:hypothetical protein
MGLTSNIPTKIDKINLDPMYGMAEHDQPFMTIYLGTHTLVCGVAPQSHTADQKIKIQLSIPFSRNAYQPG